MSGNTIMLIGGMLIAVGIVFFIWDWIDNRRKNKDACEKDQDNHEDTPCEGEVYEEADGEEEILPDEEADEPAPGEEAYEETGEENKDSAEDQVEEVDEEIPEEPDEEVEEESVVVTEAEDEPEAEVEDADDETSDTDDTSGGRTAFQDAINSYIQ